MPRGSTVDHAAGQRQILTPELCAKMLRPVLSAWYNAGMVTRDTTGRVSGAADLTGNGRHATQTAPSNRLYRFSRDSLFGNKTTIGSTVSTGYLTLATPSMTARHIIMSARYKTGIESTFAAYSFFVGGPGSNGILRVMGNTGSDSLLTGSHFADVGSKNGDTSSSAVMLPLPPSVLRFDGNVTQSWQIGGSSISGGRVLIGSIRNVVFASQILGKDIMDIIHGVIAWDGGHQSRLVASHPFRHRPPLIGVL